MANEKITKQELLTRRKQAEHAALVDYHMNLHPGMSREGVEEWLSRHSVTNDQQRAHYAEQAKKRLREDLLNVEGLDNAVVECLVDGGVKYFHTIASSLAYEQFHHIAHIMIGSPAAGC